MDQGLKERLVGAAVLVAIGVWLIPWVLDGPEAPLDAGTSSLQLPVAEEPMPMRTQTLRLGEQPAAEPPVATETPDTATPAPATLPVAASGPEADAPTAEGGTEAAASTQTSAPEPEPVASVALQEAAPAEESDSPPSAQAETPEPKPAPVVAAAAPPKPAPKPAAEPAPAGDWIVQLGSFGEQANARRVADKASTYGYTADVSSVRSDGRTLYRVRVGPATSRARADATASALRAHGIDARAVAAR